MISAPYAGVECVPGAVRALDLVRGLSCAVHSHTSVRRLLLVLTFYMDDTEDGVRSVGAMAGYIAHEDMWADFIPAWQAALNAAGVEKFHAADFFAGVRDFKGWKKDPRKHKKFERRFSKIAVDMVTLGVAQGVDLNPFNKWIASSGPILDRTPNGRMTYRMWCARKCLRWIAVNAPNRPPDEDIAVILEDGKGMGETADYLRWLKKRDVPWMAPYVSITTADKKVLPLQAADLIANHAQRELVEFLKPPNDRRPTHRSLSRLLANDLIQMDVTTEADMSSSIPRLEHSMCTDEPVATLEWGRKKRKQKPQRLPLWRRLLPKRVRRWIFRFRNWLRGRGFTDG